MLLGGLVGVTNVVDRTRVVVLSVASCFVQLVFTAVLGSCEDDTISDTVETLLSTVELAFIAKVPKRGFNSSWVFCPYCWF